MKFKNLPLVRRMTMSKELRQKIRGRALLDLKRLTNPVWMRTFVRT